MSTLKLIITLFSFSLFSKVQNSMCDNLNCFECSSNKDCIWDRSCISLSEPYDSNKWYLKYDRCDTDTYSIALKNTHCSGINQKTIPLIGGLINVNGEYGRKYLYCKFFVEADSESVLVTVRQNKDITNKNDKYAVTYFFTNESSSTTIIESLPYSVSVNINKVIFMYNSQNDPYSIEPFYINITSEKSLGTLEIILIVIGSSIGAFFIVILLFALFLYLRSLCSNKTSQHNEGDNNTTQQHESPENEEIRNRERQILIEKTFKELYPQKPYDKIKDREGIICTICREALIDGVSIIQLKCLHIFHPYCIIGHVTSGTITQKCPNCNQYLFEQNIHLETENQNEQMETDRHIVENPSTLSNNVTHGPLQSDNPIISNNTSPPVPLSEVIVVNPYSQRNNVN